MFSSLLAVNPWLMIALTFIWWSFWGLLAMKLRLQTKNLAEKRDLQNRLVSIFAGFITTGIGAYYV
jgi:predicted MFS family arabinose efflux permease